jgi:hypothetical protein
MESDQTLRMSSSLFGDLYSNAIQKPDAVFDQSSMLPPTDMSSYGPSFNGYPDARINVGNTLFGDVKPYAYGTGDRISTQTAYLANPHNIQKIVPQLILPDSNMSSKASTFLLPHSVSDGDVAFSIRFVTNNAKNAHLEGTREFTRMGAGRAVDFLCNIATVNYILRGLFAYHRHVNPAWKNFAEALGFKDAYEDIQNTYEMLHGFDALIRPENIERFVEHIQDRMRCMAENLVRDTFRPLGVVIGSAKQGGQHEFGSIVNHPVAYVVTISIDGRNENLCNFWRHMNVSAGSDLGFVVAMKNRGHYRLNLAKQVTQKHFGVLKLGSEAYPNDYPQLCPAIHGATSERKIKGGKIKKEMTGHWHFSMSQVMQQKITEEELFSDATSFHVGGLIQSTISVVWVRKRLPDPRYTSHDITVALEDDEALQKVLEELARRDAAGAPSGSGSHSDHDYGFIDPSSLPVEVNAIRAVQFGANTMRNAVGTMDFSTASNAPQASYLNHTMNARHGAIQGRIALSLDRSVRKSPYAKKSADAIPSVDVDAYREQTGARFGALGGIFGKANIGVQPPMKIQRLNSVVGLSSSKPSSLLAARSSALSSTLAPRPLLATRPAANSALSATLPAKPQSSYNVAAKHQSSYNVAAKPQSSYSVAASPAASTDMPAMSKDVPAISKDVNIVSMPIMTQVSTPATPVITTATDTVMTDTPQVDTTEKRVVPKVTRKVAKTALAEL